MAQQTKIQWCDATFNPWEGCYKVSPACLHCYAEARDKRFHARNLHWGKNAPRKMMSESYWIKPRLWNAQAKESGVRLKVFCGSLCDVAEDNLFLVAERRRLVTLIEQTPYLDWLLLTKRPQNFLKLFPWGDKRWPENIVAMTTVENQRYAEERIPELRKVPTRYRGLACEPLLGPLFLSEGPEEPIFENDYDCEAVGWTKDGANLLEGIHWVIAGGESGDNPRPSHLEWFRDLRDDCVAEGVPFFMKQWGEWIPTNQLPTEFTYEGIPFCSPPGDCVMLRIGNALAGRELDGREWNETYADREASRQCERRG